MGLHKAAWSQVVLRYIYVLVCFCKWLDAYTAFQGIFIDIKIIFETFFDHLIYNLFKFIFS